MDLLVHQTPLIKNTNNIIRCNLPTSSHKFGSALNCKSDWIISR